MNTSAIILSIVISTLLILLLISGLTISFFISGRQRNKQQMAFTLAQLQYEKELRQVETEVSETLKQHFAQELHDNIGQILTCIRLELENKKLLYTDLAPLLQPMDTYLDDAVKQLRLLSRSLNTDYVSQIGLTHAIQLEVERQQHLKRFEVHFERNYSDHSLDKNQELMIFRIFQEIIHNSMRHSKAKNLYIHLNSSPEFELCVRDDGKGFQPEEMLLTARASGLKNVMKRSLMADLVCKIDSSPGEGCRYHLSKRKIQEPAPV